jgi:hypothetical protein
MTNEQHSTNCAVLERLQQLQVQHGDRVQCAERLEVGQAARSLRHFPVVGTGAAGTKRTAGKNVGHENTSPSGLRPATSPQGEAFEENRWEGENNGTEDDGVLHWVQKLPEMHGVPI